MPKKSRSPAPKWPFPCTECSGDAEVGFSNWTCAKKGCLIGPDERLCMRCARKRGLQNPFQSPKDAKSFLKR